MKMFFTEDLEKMACILADAGDLARTAWQNQTLKIGQAEKTRPEETMDFFTTLDAELDTRIAQSIKDMLGVDRFLTEEGAKNPKCNDPGGVRAVVDSLDGSSNFATYRPDFGISIAIEINGKTGLAGIITPVRGELVVAQDGCGTFLMSVYGKTHSEIVIHAIRAAKRVTTDSFALKNQKKRSSILETSRIYVHTGKRRNFELSPNDPWNTIYAKLANPGCSFSCSVALLEVALGKLDGAAIAYQNHWDYAAGRLLVTEAEGAFEAWARDWSHILTNEELAEAHATKTHDGDEWLCHILAGRNLEIVDALRSHFVKGGVS